MTKNFSGLLGSLVVSAFLNGCETHLDSKQFEELKGDLRRTFDETSSEARRHSDELSKATGEEFAKLSIWEYRVLEVASNASPVEIESALTVAGRERWECFDMQATEKQLRFFCKRRPETYLRYIPRWMPF